MGIWSFRLDLQCWAQCCPDAVPGCRATVVSSQLPESVSSDTTTVFRKQNRSSICSGVLKARTDEDAEDEKHRLWVTALNKWLVVLRLVDFSGTVGSAIQSAESEEARHSIIRDASFTSDGHQASELHPSLVEVVVPSRV